MLSEKVRERLAETLVDRIEELNNTILEEIGKSIDEIGKLNTSQAYRILQDLKYGGSYNKIIRKLAQVTNLNEKQIYKIFEEVAKGDQNFAKQFYNYRNIDFIPYDENEELKNQVNAIARLTANQYVNLIQSSAFKTIENGRVVFTPLSRIYQHIMDQAVLSLSQGRESYQTIMRKTIRQLSDSGIRVVDYASGYSRRLDSTVRMNLLDGMRNLSNEVQKEVGKDFDYDGIEISVHRYPAPDHAEIQGRQFSLEEFEKVNNGLQAKDINGKIYKAEPRRHISEYNCYHGTFSIILGVSRPQYSDKELEKIQKNNRDGFEFEGKHYTLYEGTQLQRQIETKVRSLKDRQIGARAMKDFDEVGNCQRKIRQLTNKYNELCNISGLAPKKIRMQVSGYRRVA